MCTLILAWRVFESAPVCVAANREELYARPASRPAIRGDGPRYVAPRDEEAGGTWIGYNESGVFVAVTNRWTPGDGERSRGLLVEDVLGEPTAGDAVSHVESELNVRSYAPFYLLVADAAGCYLVENAGADAASDRGPLRAEDGAIRRDVSPTPAWAAYALEAGVHVVVNVGFDGEWFVPSGRTDEGARQARSAERVRQALEPRTGETATEWTDRAGSILGDHDYGVCVHGDGFGTRSSSLLRLGERQWYAFADGPPCETPFVAVNDMI